MNLRVFLSQEGKTSCELPQLYSSRDAFRAAFLDWCLHFGFDILRPVKIRYEEIPSLPKRGKVCEG